ncbi:MAG: hypothetical protein ACOCV2_10660 [Persicimonas sp.]
MAEEKSSQVHNNFAFFQDLMQGQLERLDAWYEQTEKFQQEGFERADEALENATDLTRASMEYAQELTQQAWKLGMETARRSAQAFERS